MSFKFIGHVRHDERYPSVTLPNPRRSRRGQAFLLFMTVLYRKSGPDRGWRALRSSASPRTTAAWSICGRAHCSAPPSVVLSGRVERDFAIPPSERTTEQQGTSAIRAVLQPARARRARTCSIHNHGEINRAGRRHVPCVENVHRFDPARPPDPSSNKLAISSRIPVSLVQERSATKRPCLRRSRTAPTAPRGSDAVELSTMIFCTNG